MADTKEKITGESEVSTTELATVLGVTARRVQQLAFLLISVESYLSFLDPSLLL